MIGFLDSIPGKESQTILKLALKHRYEAQRGREIPSSGRKVRELIRAPLNMRKAIFTNVRLSVLKACTRFGKLLRKLDSWKNIGFEL